MSLTDLNRGSKPRNDLMILAGFALLFVLFVVFLGGQRDQRLHVSPSGFDGLSIWLKSQNIDAQVFNGGWPIDKSEIGFLVLPIYDSDPRRDRQRPRTKEELLFQQDENDIFDRSIIQRINLVPSLVVLPKWRSGMRLTGLGHPALLIEERRPQIVLSDVIGGDPKVRRIRRPFSDFEYRPDKGGAMTARLYVAQTFTAPACRPMIGDAQEMILGRCRTEDGTEVLVLSDPDLLSNHGLRLGENAAIAADLIADQVGSGQVIIDYSLRNWIIDRDARPKRERTWEDFLRFFSYPFSLLWLGSGLLLGLVLWRSGLRFGPITASTGALGASKQKSIAARARLMRLSGQDGELLKSYADARLNAVARKFFGPADKRHLEDETALLRLLDRQRPDVGARLRATLAKLRALPATVSPTEAIQNIEELEQTLEQISHDT